MATVALHSLFEYIIVIKEVQYVLAIIFGMTFGLAHQVKVARATTSAVYQGRIRSERPVAGRALM